MSFWDDLFGSPSQSEYGSQYSERAISLPTTSTTQRGLESTISEWLKSRVSQGAQPFPGALTPDIPELFREAYSGFQYSPFAEDISAATRDLISGVPAYAFDPAKTTEKWVETYAAPVMKAWEKYVLPLKKEEWNIPGVYASRTRTREVAKAGEEFMTTRVAPTLFEALQTGEKLGALSAEQAAERKMAATSMPYQQFSQAADAASKLYGFQAADIAANYQEFLRTRAEPGWPISTAMGYMTTPTIQNLVLREGSSWGEQTGETSGWLGGVLGGVGEAGLGMMMDPSTAWNWGSLALGGLAGLSDARLKSNPVMIKSALARVKLLRGYTYEIFGTNDAGIMAQDLEKVLPEGVVQNQDGIKFVKIPAVVALLVNAVNELADKMEVKYGV